MATTLTYDQAVTQVKTHMKTRADQSRKLEADIHTFITNSRQQVEAQDRSREGSADDYLNKQLG